MPISALDIDVSLVNNEIHKISKQATIAFQRPRTGPERDANVSLRAKPFQ